jgi:transcriptional regulator with XRE-family HTH domain
MPPHNDRGPVLTRRRLRFELRRLREDAGLSLEQVAREMVWSVSKVVRIENGSVGISVNDTKALLAMYGATDSRLVDELLVLAKDSRRRMWWAHYRDQIAPSFLDLIGLEADAARILHFHPFLVPGLLQTEEYARAVTENDPVETGSPVHVEIRMRRKQQLFDRPAPPDYVTVLDEAVLYRRMGGSTVLRDQLNSLLDYAREPNISIVVLPMDTQEHPAHSSGFTILEFADPTDPPIVFHDQPGSGVAADSPQDVDGFRERFARLLELGLHGQDAIALIRTARDKAR